MTTSLPAPRTTLRLTICNTSAASHRRLAAAGLLDGNPFIGTLGGEMANYYWTKTEEEPAVYHDNENCSEGKKIEPQNREDGSSPPAGRRLCEVCSGL